MKFKEMRERNKAILFGTAVVIGMFGLAYLGSVIIGGPIGRTDIEDVRIEITGDVWTIECALNSTVNNTVYLLLKECGELKDFDVEGTVWQPYNAIFVNSINDLGNNEGKYWQYYVNGRYGSISSDRKRLVDGDLVEWKWEVPRI